jgi:predicted Rossmann fold nucleotide-binding protein DprA/Smf involved in DNA uptake
MKKLKEQLKAVSKELVKLSKQVEKATVKVDKLIKADAKKATKKATTKKAAPKKTTAKKAVKKTAAKKPAAKKKAKAAPKKAAAKKPTVLDAVYGVIGKARNGATIAQLKQKTGLSPRQLSNALYKLSTRGKIVAKSRGLYIKK